MMLTMHEAPVRKSIGLALCIERTNRIQQAKHTSKYTARQTNFWKKIDTFYFKFLQTFVARLKF